MLNEIINYYAKLYCPSIARKAVIPLLLSGFLSKWAKKEEEDNFRYRLNILLQWEHGWWKSSLLKRILGYFPCKTNVITDSSSAALRGSFADEMFYPPEFLLADILVFPEFSAMLEGRNETVTQLLNALEDGLVRVGLVKGANLSEEELEVLEGYGATFEDLRLSYYNNCAVWGATHTIDNIKAHNRDALLSRFFVCQVLPIEIPHKCAYANYLELQDLEFEKKIEKWIHELYKKDEEPNHEFAQEVVNILWDKHNGTKRKPRQIDDIRRISLSYKLIKPKANAEKCAKLILSMENEVAGLSSRELIANYIFQSPKSFSDISGFTGLSKSNIYNHLKRLGAQKKGRRPTLYYLDSCDEEVKKSIWIGE